MTQLKHFYLGCETNHGRFIGIQANVAVCLMNDGITTTHGHIDDLKLILRRLSSMTESEKEGFSRQTIESLHDIIELKTHFFNPNLADIPKLFADGYDLFNLINSNKAIEKQP